MKLFEVHAQNHTIHYTLTINPEEDTEMPLMVKVTYYPGERGARERGTGVPLEPDSPAHIEINDILTQDGHPLSPEIEALITPKVEQDIVDAAFDQIEW